MNNPEKENQWKIKYDQHFAADNPAEGFTKQEEILNSK